MENMSDLIWLMMINDVYDYKMYDTSPYRDDTDMAIK